MQKTMGAAEWGMLLVLSLLWGGSFFFIGVAVKEIPTFTVMLLRVSISAVVLIVAVHMMGQRLPREPGSGSLSLAWACSTTLFPRA